MSLPWQKATQHPGSVASLEYPRGEDFCYISIDITMRWLFISSHSLSGFWSQHGMRILIFDSQSVTRGIPVLANDLSSGSQTSACRITWRPCYKRMLGPEFLIQYVWGRPKNLHFQVLRRCWCWSGDPTLRTTSLMHQSMVDLPGVYQVRLHKRRTVNLCVSVFKSHAMTWTMTHALSLFINSWKL